MGFSQEYTEFESEEEESLEEFSFERDYLSVGDVTRYLEGLINDDPILGGTIRVRGELSNVKRSARGHVYFTLKDTEASISGIIWASLSKGLSFVLEDGIEVDIVGTIEIYAPNGTYSIVAKRIEPVGAGALQQLFEELKARLSAEGLFLSEHKKPIPEFPRRIGIITSRTGAVIHDMLRVIRRKNPFVDVLIAPVKVQGDGAAMEIAAAVQELNHPNYNLDLLIVARGGGSMEDLFCFSEEPVVRAIFQSELPVITGIGHEPDYSLADAVADYSASTPTAAAEYGVPDLYQIQEILAHYQELLASSLQQSIYFFEQMLDGRAQTFVDSHRQMLETTQQQVHFIQERLMSEMHYSLERLQQSIAQTAFSMDAYNPLGTLARGYAIAITPHGEVISSVQRVQPGDSLTLKLSDGQLNCEVRSHG